MALTATVTKKNITSSKTGYFSIVLNLKVNDGSTDVIDKDFGASYRSEHDVLSEVRDSIQAQMQAEIDNYKDGNTMSGNAQLATAISTIQSNLVL